VLETTVDLTLTCDGITLVIGPNGAGKGVLLRILAGLERPPGGRIVWGGWLWRTGSGKVPGTCPGGAAAPGPARAWAVRPRLV